MQIRPVRAAPQAARDAMNSARCDIRLGKVDSMRRRPKLPSFRRTLARIIEPAVGASTWAFGSHKWTE